MGELLPDNSGARTGDTALDHLQNFTPGIVPGACLVRQDEADLCWEVRFPAVGKETLPMALAARSGPAPQKRGGRSDLSGHSPTPTVAHGKDTGREKWRDRFRAVILGAWVGRERGL